MDKQTTLDLFGEIDSDFGNDKTSEISLDDLLLTNHDDGNFFEDITLNTADFKIQDNELEIEKESVEESLMFDLNTNDNLTEDIDKIALVDNVEMTIQGFENAASVIEDIEILEELNQDIEVLEAIEEELIEEVEEEIMKEIDDEIIHEIEDVIEDLEYMGMIAPDQEAINQIQQDIERLAEIHDQKVVDSAIDDIIKQNQTLTQEVDEVLATLENAIDNIVTQNDEQILENDVNGSVENNIFSESIVIEEENNDDTIIIEQPVREKFVNTTKLNTNLGDFTIVSNQESDEIKITVEEEMSIVTKDEFGQVNIMVIGIGGCGCNIINRMFAQKNDQIKLIAMDTSGDSLENISSDYKLLIGEDEFAGFGSGGDTAMVERAFETAKPKIQSLLKDVDMVFLAGGIGRGTGSVGLVKVGKFAKELGILTIGFATLPRKREANPTILEKYYPLVCESVDSTIIVENERVSQQAKNLPINAAMAVADAMLIDGIKGVFELITKPGKINLDYADIKTAFSDQGSSVMGIGFGKGENAVVKAIENAFHSEVTDFDSIKTARTIIFNITCARQTITIDDATKGTERLYSYGSGQNMNHLLFGYSYDESLADEVKVTFIATGTTPAEYDFSRSLTSARSEIAPKEEKIRFSETQIFGSSIEPKKEETARSFPDFFKK